MSRHKKKYMFVAAAACLAILVYHFTLIALPPFQEQNRIEFQHLTIEDGLPQNTVFCICQDRRGFLWFGTEDGLCRYDGYTYKPYQYDPEDSSSISNNRINCILEDRSGNLWIGTEDGLNLFDRLHETFTRYKHDPEKPAESLSNNTIRSILEDHHGVLWVGTNDGGLHYFNPQKQSFTCFKPSLRMEACNTPELDSNDKEECKINILYEDKSLLLWVGTSHSLCRFDRQEKKFTHFLLPPDDINQSFSSEITAIYEDRAGVLWIGTKNGRLLQRERTSGQFIPFIYDAQISRNEGEFQVLAIFEDQSREFWVGVYGAGLYRVNRQNKTSVGFKEHPWLPDSLSSNHIHTIFQDRGEIIWIGTDNGLNKLDKRRNEFVHWTTEAGNQNSLSNNMVWSICQDNSGDLWIGTDKGLNRLNRKSGVFTHYRHDPQNPKSLSNDRVLSILTESPNTLWVGTEGGGLNRMDMKTGTFTRYIPNPGVPGQLSHVRINALAFDHQGNLWVGTQGGGLDRLHRESDTFTNYRVQDDQPGNLSHNEVTCIYEDSAGNLWIATDGGGLNLFHHITATFTAYRNDPRNSESLSTDKVSAIYEDLAGTLWICTYEGGLNQLINRDNGTFRHFRKKDGLPNDTIFGILGDKQDNLWISTVNGLSKYDRKAEQFKNYFVGDGLQSNEFNGGAYFKAKNGEMFFGGINGFNCFFPELIIDNSNLPKVVITNFLIFNKPYKDTSITEMDKVVLSYDQDVFSIEFAALDFSSPGKNTYKYQMNNVDRDWVTGDAKQRMVNYTKLSPGEYQFQVGGTNNDQLMSTETAKLLIVIEPPYWQTWWFRGLLGVFILLSILAFHLTRTRLLRKKLAEQKRIQEILKESHDEMERARDLAELRHAENEKLLSSISALFIAVDSSGIIFQWNKTAEKLFCIPAAEAEKRPFFDILKNYINENSLNNIMELGLKQDKHSKLIELNIDLKARGKGIRVLAGTVSPIRDSAGKKLGFLFMAEDITNRKEEEILSHLSRKLESLGQMASGIAHEIKTPLQYIGHNAAFVSDSFRDVSRFYRIVNDHLAHLEQLGNTDLPRTVKELIAQQDMEYIMTEIPTAADQIISGVTRVSNIIQAMNEFSHPGRGYKEKADINHLLETTLVMVQSKIKKSADIQLQLAEGLPLIPCFAGELNQVFMNLLSNALDAIIETGRWGLIRITTRVEDNELVISISDTGCGIPEEHRENIFTPFFTTKAIGKGTGQGLSLAHNVIIEKHKGRLSFSSQLGKGTTFYIRLPIEGEQ